MKEKTDYTKVVSVTGLRRQKLYWKSSDYSLNEKKLMDIFMEILIPLIEQGYNVFLSGMATGSDLIFAKTILELKKQYDHLILEAIIPFKSQESSYNISDKNDYSYILSSCNIVRVLQNNYSKDCFFKRNKYLINSSNILISVTNDTKLFKSGTTQTIGLAKKKDILVINIDPYNFTYKNV